MTEQYDTRPPDEQHADRVRAAATELNKAIREAADFEVETEVTLVNLADITAGNITHVEVSCRKEV